MDFLTLSEAEIIAATGYRHRTKQLQVLLRAGIPADRRPDGTVRVWRHHLIGRSEPVEQREEQPRLKFQRRSA